MKKIVGLIIVFVLVFSNLMFASAKMQSSIMVDKNQTTSLYSYTLKANGKGGTYLLGIPIHVKCAGDIYVTFSKEVKNASTLLTDIDLINTQNPDTKKAIYNGIYTKGLTSETLHEEISAPKTMYFYVFGGEGVKNDTKVTLKVSHKEIKVKKIKLKKVKNVKKKKVDVEWSKIKQDFFSGGYQICYARNKKMTKGKRIINIKDQYETSKTIKKLKKKKTYYFSVRAYRLIDNKQFFSEWSKIKKVKIKK